MNRRSALLRGSVTAGGMYVATVLGVLGTIVALRVLGPDGAGRFSLAVGTAAFFQVLLELTSDEALIKFGFRYIEQETWGKFHRLVRLMFSLELYAGVAAGVLVLALGAVSPQLFHAHLFVPMALAALLPPLQAIESMAAAAMVLRRRYDVRGVFLTFSMALRLVAIAIGAPRGVTAAVIAVLIAQIVTTLAIGAAGIALMRRFPSSESTPLGDDRKPLLSFIVQSSAGSTLASLRAWAAPLLLGIVRNPSDVAFFRGAQAPLLAFAAFSGPLRLILLTEQTREWERGNAQKVFRDVRRYTIGATLLSVVAIVPLELATPWLVKLFLGSKYEPATTAVRIILVAAMIQLVFGWTKSLPISIGRPGLRVVSSGIEAATLLPLVVLFGSLWGVTGAAGAVLASTVVFALTWLVLLQRLTAGRLRPVEPAPA